MAATSGRGSTSGPALRTSAVLVEATHAGGTRDQLNVPPLASFEVTARRIQSIVDAYSDDPAPPQRSNARLYSGAGSAADMVAHELKHA